jgi:hypothetical protein
MSLAVTSSEAILWAGVLAGLMLFHAFWQVMLCPRDASGEEEGGCRS